MNLISCVIESWSLGRVTLQGGPTCGPGWLWMWPHTKSYIMHGPFFCSSVFISVSVFNVWPKITLLLAQPRDAKRWDTPKSFLIENFARKVKRGRESKEIRSPNIFSHYSTKVSWTKGHSRYKVGHVNVLELLQLALFLPCYHGEND